MDDWVDVFRRANILTRAARTAARAKRNQVGGTIMQFTRDLVAESCFASTENVTLGESCGPGHQHFFNVSITGIPFMYDDKN